MTERSVRVYLGYAMPRRGRQITLMEHHGGDALLAAVHAAFNLPLRGEPYGVFVALKGTEENVVLGNLADANAPPCAALDELDAQGLPYELVALPLAEMAAAGRREAPGLESSESDAALADAMQNASLDDTGQGQSMSLAASASRGGGGGGGGGGGNDLAELSAADVDALDRRTADKFADKLARRIAKLTTYAETRSAAMQPGDVVVQRKLQRAAKEIAYYSEQLVLIEEHIAELDMLAESESEASDARAHSSAAAPARRERSGSKRGKSEASASKSRSTPKLRARKPRKKKKAGRADSDSASAKDRPTVPAQCGMCKDEFGLDPERPRWVYVPANSGVQRYVVCAACRASVKDDDGAQTEDWAGDDDDSNSSGSSAKAMRRQARRRSIVVEQFRARMLAHCGPSEPVLFGNLRVPRYMEQRQRTYSGSLLLSPDIVVSRFKECGTLHIKYLMNAQPIIVSNESPITSIRYAEPYVLTLHQNDTLQAIDVVAGELRATVDIGPMFVDDGGGRSRSLIANERWVVIASKERVCVWPWRVLLTSAAKPKKAAATPAAHTMLLDEGSADNPRNDFCAIRNHFVLLGSNQSFSVWDVLAERCIYHFSFRSASSDMAIAAFYSVRLAGEFVITQEAGGVRVWPVVEQVARERERGDAAVLPIKAKLPPLLAPARKGTIFTSVYSDGTSLLLGDSSGMLRVRPLVSKVSSKAASLMGNVDSDGLPIEYLNSEAWLKAAARMLPDSKKVGRNSLALSNGAPQQAALLRGGSKASLEHKINFISQHNERVFCAQENGLVTVWSLHSRDSKEPLAKYALSGPVRFFDQHEGTAMAACTEPLVSVAAGDDTSGGGAIGAGGGGGGADDDADDELDDRYQYLKVMVSSFGQQGVQLGRIACDEPLPRGEKTWRLALFFGADVDPLRVRAPNSPSANSPWAAEIIERFTSLSMRAEAQRAYFVGVSALDDKEIAEERRKLGLPMRIVGAQSMYNALGRCGGASGDFATTWYEPTETESEATIVVMPGAEPFNPLALLVLVNIDGFIHSYAISARYAIEATPARIWAFVNKQLLAPTMHAQRPRADNNSLTRRRRLGGLFRKK